MILVTAEQMRQADRRTIEEVGLPGAVLMENAAQGAVRVLAAQLGEVEGLDIAALCGRGNNGGDGLAMLRILANRGACCRAYLMCRGQDLAGDAALNLKVALACGVEVVEVVDDKAFQRLAGQMAGHQLYLDALLGTGLNSPVRGLYREAIELLNSLPAPVMAVDIPSGLSADTGVPLGLAVRADLTATFGLVKLGLACEPGDYVGELYLVDISIPPQVSQDLGSRTALLSSDMVAELLPARPAGGHKGTFGHLMVVGGSLGKSGAVCLAAMGGLRAGAGLVTVGLPTGLNAVAEAKLTAAMSQPLPQTSEGGLSLEALPVLLEMMSQRQALALGPGLGASSESRELALQLMSQVKQPMVIDADGLNGLAGNLDQASWASPQVVLTPHPGEAARLLDCQPAQVQADRPAAAMALAQRCRAVVLLKGARSLVATPQGELWVNPTGNPLLASGGSGDLLTGLLGGLLAQGLGAVEAACLGAFLHGLAAEMAAADFGRRGLAAEELADYLPQALLALEGGPSPEPDEEPAQD